jgi:hypothetical protein
MTALSSSERQREAKDKDKDEIEQKRQEYSEFMSWRDRGIIFELEGRCQVANPTLSLLLSIALSMSSLIGVPIGRQEKRRRDLLVGWLNMHYDEIKKYIPRMVIDDKGELKGPGVAEWMKYKQEHPDAEIHRYLSKD